jgi:hypothetical protein
MTDQPPPKFRVWDGEEMHEPAKRFRLFGDGRLYKNRHGFAQSTESTEDYVLMHSTSLTDAEGTEVWEADILQAERRIYGRDQPIAEVVWEQGKFFLDFVSGGGLSVDDVLKNQWAVIGNRYEDPKLMEEVSTDE